MQVWDPIGVKSEPNAQDEYDGYIGQVYELLVTRASDESIGEYLWRVVTERMGLQADKNDMRDTVAALRQIDTPRSSAERPDLL